MWCKKSSASSLMLTAPVTVLMTMCVSMVVVMPTPAIESKFTLARVGSTADIVLMFFASGFPPRLIRLTRLFYFSAA